MKKGKRFLGLLLALLLLVETIPVRAEESVNVAYYTIPFTTEDGKNGDILLRCEAKKVWCSAQQLGSILGWDVSVDENTANVRNDNFCSQILFALKRDYAYKSWSTYGQRYELPFACVKEEDNDRFWIPFDSAVALLDSFHLEAEQGIFFGTSKWSVLNCMSWVDKNRSDIMFDVVKEFGYTSGDVIVDASCARLIDYAEMLKGILEGDGSSIIGAIPTFVGKTDAYDAKYGEKLAQMLTINSDKELKEQIAQFGLMKDLLAPNGKLASFMNYANQAFEETAKGYVKECEQWISDVEKAGTELSLMQCDAYHMYHKTLENWGKFEKVDEFVANVQNECENLGMDKIAKMSKVLEGITVLSDFTNRDKFALEAFENYLSQAQACDYVPKVSLLTLEDKVMSLNSTVIGYGFTEYVKKYVKEWVDKTIGENMISLSGMQQLALFVWNLMENHVPFLKNGLSSLENMELYLYAYCFQASTSEESLRLKNQYFSGDDFSEEHLYQLAQAYYIFLKTAYVTKEAGSGILDGKKVSQEAKNVLKEHLNTDNQKIAEMMAVLRRAECTETGETDNENGAFGLLPSENEQYVKKAREQNLAETVKNLGEMNTESVRNQMNIASLNLKEGYYEAEENGKYYEMALLKGEKDKLHIQIALYESLYGKESDFLEFDLEDRSGICQAVGQYGNTYSIEIMGVDEDVHVTLAGEQKADLIFGVNKSLRQTNIILAVKEYFRQNGEQILECPDTCTFPVNGLREISYAEAWDIGVDLDGEPLYEVLVSGYEHEVVGQASVFDGKEFDDWLVDGVGSPKMLVEFSVFDYFDFSD